MKNKTQNYSLAWALMALVGFLVFFNYRTHLNLNEISGIEQGILKVLYIFAAMGINFMIIKISYQNHIIKGGHSYKRYLNLLFQFIWLYLFFAIIMIPINGFVGDDILSIILIKTSGSFDRINIDIWWYIYSMLFATIIYSFVADKIEKMDRKKLLKITIGLFLLQTPGFQLLKFSLVINPAFDSADILPRYLLSLNSNNFIHAFSMILVGVNIRNYKKELINGDVFKWTSLIFITLLIPLALFVVWGGDNSLLKIPTAFKDLLNMDGNGSIMTIVMTVLLFIIIMNINITKAPNRSMVNIVIYILLTHQLSWRLTSALFDFDHYILEIGFWMIISWLLSVTLYGIPKLLKIEHLFVRFDNRDSRRKKKVKLQ